MKKKLMLQYAKLCGYNYPPFSWSEDDYTPSGWAKLIAGQKKENKKIRLAEPRYKYTKRFLNRFDKLLK